MSHVIIEGNVTAKPEGGYGQASGEAFAKVKVAVNNRVKNQDGSYSEGPTSYYRVTVFGALAEHALNELDKGTPIVAAGDLTVEGFTRDDATKGISNEVVANTLAVSLRFGGVSFTRPAKASTEPTE